MEVNYIPDDESIANVFCFGEYADKVSGVVYNDLTGNFPSSFFVLYHYKTDAILVKAIANVDDHSIFATYKEIFETLEATGYKPKMNVMEQSISKSFSPKTNAIYNLWSHTVTTSMPQNGRSKHLRMHSLWRSQPPIKISHYSCGIGWHHRYKTH
jgi:hypothetical protein